MKGNQIEATVKKIEMITKLVRMTSIVKKKMMEYRG